MCQQSGDACMRRSHRSIRSGASMLAAAGLLAGLALVAAPGSATAAPGADDAGGVQTATPIKHLVVIYDENISFDHYFGTYPNAANPAGEPRFVPAPDTPKVNGLTGVLLQRNPNMLNPANGEGAVNPFRLDRSRDLTADQDHDYMAE